jgi:two-component system LytT family response regulator
MVSDGNYTRVYRYGEARFLLVSQTLKFFADQLPGFIRATKGTLINPGLVKQAININSKTMQLELTTGQYLSVSRRRIETVLAQLAEGRG